MSKQPERIYEKFWNGRQDLRYEAHFEYDGNKFRVSIRRDSIDLQENVSMVLLLRGIRSVIMSPIRLMSLLIQEVERSRTGGVLFIL